MANVIFGNHSSAILPRRNRDLLLRGDLSFYEGAEAGPNVEKVKAALEKEALKP